MIYKLKDFKLQSERNEAMKHFKVEVSKSES